MRQKLYLLFSVCFALSFSLYAQTDTTFWFAAPDLQQGHGDRPIYLRLSTGASAATVTITVPANSAFVPIIVSVPMNSSQSVDLTPFIDQIENSVVNAVANRGIRISSTALISCYYDIANGLNGDIYALKGSNALGFKFTVPFQMVFDGSGLPNYTASFSIVATEDNTLITITPKNNLLAYPAGIPFTITLNKGQTYTCQAATNTPAARPGGTVVISNKRIAISIKDDSIRYPGGGCSDTAGDQLIPDCNAGTSFVIPKGHLNGADYYYIFAINDNTSVSVNGAVVATIAAGNYYTGTLSDPSCFIQTSSPVQVFHVSGFGCEVGGAVVPAIDNEGSSFIGVTRASSNPFFINVITTPANVSGFTVNGLSTVLQASDFSPVPGTNGNRVVARIQISTSLANAGQSIRVQHSVGKFHMGVIHGDVSSTTRYGYFSDFERVNIDIAQYDTLYCKGSNISLSASAPGASDFQWSGPNGFSATGSILQINNFQVIHQGFYTVSANSARCGYVERRIWVGIQLPAADFTPTTQCLNAGPVLFSSSSSVNAGMLTNFTWRFGTGDVATGQQVNYQYSVAGTYTVTLLISSNKGCRDSIQRAVSILAPPIVQVTPDGPISLCVNQTRTLNANVQPGSGSLVQLQWYWNGNLIAGATQTSWLASQSGTYTVEARNSNGCQQTSTPVVITVHPSPVGGLVTPSVSTLCEGGTLSLTATGGATYQWFLNAAPLSVTVGPTIAASQPGVYTVEIISAQGCRAPGAGSITLTMINKPVADFSVLTQCAMNPSAFTNLSNIATAGVVSWEWSFGDGGRSTLFAPSYTYSRAGRYQVTLKITPLACPSLETMVTKPLDVEDSRANIRYRTVNALIDQPYNLQSRTFGSSYTWSPSIGLSSATISNPVFRHTQGQEYLITIRTTANCVTVDTQAVRIFANGNILVPTAFTPDNDRLNDQFEFFLIGIKQFNFLRIFNRWGQLVFETNSEQRFWDGTVNGIKQAAGVYAWYAEGITVDDIKIFKKGLVTLVRK